MTSPDIVFPRVSAGEGVAVNEELRALEARILALEQVRVPKIHEEGQCYQAGQMVVVREQGHTVVAKRNTCQSPLIYPAEEGRWLTGKPPDDATEFTEHSLTVSLKLRGTEYDVPADRWFIIQNIAFLVPHNATTQSYRIMHSIYREATDEWVVTPLTGPFTATNEDEWLLFGTQQVWEPGSKHRIYVLINSTASPTVFAGPWTQVNTNAANPSSGNMNFRNNEVEMAFNNTDGDGVNRAVELALVPPGGYIQRSDGTSWVIDSVDQSGSATTFMVSPGGQRGSAGDYTFTFEYGTPEPLWHKNIVNFWAGNENVRGITANDSGPITTNTSQFMTDAFIQEIVMSDDYILISTA